MTLGDSILIHRKHAGMSQLQLGIELGCSQGQVSDWELGYHMPNWALLRKLIGVFGISLITDALEDMDES